MFTSVSPDSWSEIVVDADSWREGRSLLRSEAVVGTLAAADPRACGRGLASDLVANLIGPDSVLHVEMLALSDEGALLRGVDDPTDPSLLAWAVSLLWWRGDMTEHLRHGRAIGRSTVVGSSTAAQACLPFVHGRHLGAVLACTFIVDSDEELRDAIGRLTLIGRLLPGLHWAHEQHRGVDGAAHSAASGAAAAVPRGDDPELSARQLLVVDALADGLTNRQIAVRIAYSESTVRMETMAIYRHLGVGSRAEAVVQARLRGIIPGDPGRAARPGVPPAPRTPSSLPVTVASHP